MRLLYMVPVCIFFAATIPAYAQKDSSGQSSSKGLFESNEVLHIKLTGNLRDLMNDRGDKPKLHPLTISYTGESGTEVALPIQAKTRGHFRKALGGCTYPPILLQFSKNDALASSVFSQQSKLKLVMPCRGDEYVLHEWMPYRIYNLVTPESFRARLVSVELNDTRKNKTTPPFYGFLLEEDHQVASRNHEVLIKRKMTPEQMAPDEFLKMAVFEYLIGNTDWSVEYQNIKILAPDSNSVPVSVPYDFDFSGLVNAPYAQPPEELRMTSVRERRYRGYCVQDMKVFDDVIAFYNQIKPDIYKLYTDCTLLDAKYVKETLAYFDQFYKTINDPAAVKKEFGYPCDKNGTGNVVIRGLKGNPQPQDDEDADQ